MEVGRVEKRLETIRKLLQTGMKMLVKMQEDNREFRKATRRAIRVLKGTGRNGHRH